MEVNQLKKKQTMYSAKLVKSLRAQNFNEILKSSEKWTDDLFTPTETSIFNGKTEFSYFSGDQNKMKQNKMMTKVKEDLSNKYIWKRLSEMFKPGEINILKEPVEIKDDPDILTEDVVQGELGDCYFLSAISAIAENPERLGLLFPHLEFVEQGVFLTKVYIHGEPVEIVVDDYFPFFRTSLEKNTPKIAFVGFNERSRNIWPMILEKVWAKVNITYEDIIAGNSAEAFEFLSSAPIETYYHDVNLETLFKEIQSADKKDYIICSDITVTEKTNTLFLAKMGLIVNHAYTVIDTAEFEHYGKNVRLLKIRNPWGSNEWTGDWSDKSTKWTPELKKTLKFNDEDDGTFWMRYEDFCRFYTSTHICMIHTDYNFISKRFNYDKDTSFNLVQIEIPQDTKGFFIVNQKNTRIYKNAKGIEDFENKYCSMIVFKEVAGDYIYIGASCGRMNRIYVECEDMKKGTYYIAVSFPVKQKANLSEYVSLKSKSSIVDSISYRIGIYSPMKDLKILDLKGEEEKEKSQDFLRDIMFDLAEKNPNIYNFTDEGEKDSWRSISFEKEAGAYGFIAYENKSNGFIHEHLTFSQFYNLNVIPILGKGDITSLNLKDEDAVEDLNERESRMKLRKHVDLESSVKVLNVVPDGEEITQNNPIELLVKVAPKSRCLILIEKVEEDASIELSSRIAVSYPTHALLDTSKFPSRKNRIKYAGKLVEIYECVTEHTGGVILLYKNKTTDLKMSCHVKFPELVNLKMSDHIHSGHEEEEDHDHDHHDLDEDNIILTTENVKIEDATKETIIELQPGETKFLELTSLDVFESFSYSCHMDYKICMARNKIRK